MKILPTPRRRPPAGSLFALAVAATMALSPTGPAAAATAPSHAHAAATRPAPSHPAAGGPKSIGKFEDWQAATHDEGGQTICYAFTRAAKSDPALPGRGDVVLTVTERSNLRDAVALSAGFAYPAGAQPTLAVEPGPSFTLYTANRSAFARDGHAVAEAFRRGRQASIKSTAPRDQTVSDTFNLRGFEAAYAAIIKACPAK